LEDRPDHHKEIQTPINLDILTFLHFIYGTSFHREFYDFTIFIFVLSLKTCIGDDGSKYRFMHIISIRQVVYVQRIRCSENSP
jgi:hypothetical protein